jgi:hypothetical protein
VDKGAVMLVTPQMGDSLAVTKNYSLLALLLIVHTRRIGLASGTAKT